MVIFFYQNSLSYISDISHTDSLSSGEIPVSLHREAELTKELLEVLDVQPGAGPVRVELRPEEGLVVDQQCAAPEYRKLPR